MGCIESIEAANGAGPYAPLNPAGRPGGVPHSGGMPPGTTYVQENCPVACPRCHGCGFSHDSDMTHDKPQGEKCFFCTPCKGCGGRGVISGGTSTVSHNQGFFPGTGGTTIVQENRPVACLRCHGCGFSHDSNMRHDKPQGEKCFFCTPCKACDGKGVVSGGTSTISHNQGYFPGTNSNGQGFYPGTGSHSQGFYPDTSNNSQGFSPAQNQGFSPAQNQGFSPAQNQGFSPAEKQGFSPAENQGFMQ